jgi:hypothetical protein
LTLPQSRLNQENLLSLFWLPRTFGTHKSARKQLSQAEGIELAITMKSWTILALLVAICAVFLGVGHTEETADDFRETVLEDAYTNTENDAQL